MTAAHPAPCGHVTAIPALGAITCGSAQVRFYVIGWRCITHSPAVRSGRIVPEPPPAYFTVKQIQRPPLSSTALNDNRAIASGKRRSTPARYAEARRAIGGAA